MKNSAVSLKWLFLKSSGGLRELRWGGVFTPSFPFPCLVAVDLFIDRTAQHLHLHRDHPEESKGIERVRRLFNAPFADLLFLSLLVGWQNPSQREYVVVVGLVYGRGLPFDFDSNKKMNVTLTSLFADSIKWKSIAEENNSTSSQSAAVSHLFFFSPLPLFTFFIARRRGWWRLFTVLYLRSTPSLQARSPAEWVFLFTVVLMSCDFDGCRCIFSLRSISRAHIHRPISKGGRTLLVLLCSERSGKIRIRIRNDSATYCKGR